MHLLIKLLSLLTLDLIILLNLLLFNNIKINIFNYDLKLYKKYIKKCTRFKKYSVIKSLKKINPYLSVVLPVYNMEIYIERVLLSILNQSFQDFEIIIINDFSNDNTKKIIQRYSKMEDKIRIIEHSHNLGIYISRINGILNSKGLFVLLIDPDDILLNPYLFQKIYEINNKYNLDIIEFVVFYEKEGNNRIIIPVEHRLNHFHSFSEKIINNSQLSNILFFEPSNKNISGLICRSIWNKIIKKNILLKTINFIGEENYNYKGFNYAEDTIMNIINFQFANNYTNINVPGYLYNFRKNSISHKNLGSDYNIKISINFLLYLKLLYKYIKSFQKDRNILFNELKEFKWLLLQFKLYNLTKYINNTKDFLNDILRDKHIEKPFKKLIINISQSFN